MVELCSPERLAKWLFERLKDSAISEYIPQENLGLICDRAMFFFYKGGKLEANGLMEWLETEYNVPAETVSGILAGLVAPAQAKLAVKIIMPAGQPSAPPATDEASGDAKVTITQVPPDEEPPDSVEELLPPEEPPVPSEEQPQAPSESIADIEPAPEEAPPPPPEGAGAIGPRKAWEYMKPTPRDPARNLGGFLHDSAYLEWAILDKSHDRASINDVAMNSALSRLSEFSDEEKASLADFNLKPGNTDNNSTTAWCLRMNGVALAYAYALELATGAPGFDMAEWVRGVRQLNATFGDMAGKIMGKRAEARKLGEPGLEAFETTYQRLKQIHGQVEPLFWKQSGGTSPAAQVKAQAAKPVPKPTPPKPSRAIPGYAEESGLRGIINRNSGLFIIVGLVVTVISIGYAVYASGLLRGSEIKTMQIDLSSSGLKVTSATAQRKILVVEVEENSWTKLSVKEKDASIDSLYSVALKNGLDNVQIKSATGDLLAYVWSNTKYKIMK